MSILEMLPVVINSFHKNDSEAVKYTK